MNYLVSIIVPIYNVEKYLHKCIDSILNQTLKNIEIILVNDGSTDNCGKIIDEYAKKDERIIVIHKENEGQSSARNKGLDIARGKYIGFVDSDDWLHHDMYENLYNAINESNADLCICGREAYSEDRILGYQIKLENELIDLNEYDIRDYISSKLFYKHTVSSCNKIYKKEIIKNNNIRFEDVSYVGSEDALFNYQYLLIAKKIKSIDKIGYSQLSRNGSTATTYKSGYMLRTANMINVMDANSNIINCKDKNNYIDISLFALYFYQRCISQSKLHCKNEFKEVIYNELKSSVYNETFMKYIKVLALNNNINKYMKNMGFSNSGIYYIKCIMGLYYIKNLKLTVRLINLK